MNECPQLSCKCTAKVQELDDTPQSMILKLVEDNVSVGQVTIAHLEPGTNYTAVLSCQNGQSSANANLSFKTDYERPLPPVNITASLVSGHVQIAWLPPAAPADSFSNYILKIDGKELDLPIPEGTNLYRMPDPYQDGSKHTFQVKTCYKNNQDSSICSASAKGMDSFFVPITSGPSISSTSNITPTTKKSSDAPTTSISISMLLFSLLLINEIFQ